MTVTLVALFILGIAALVVGAEMLIRGAASLAVAAGVSPLVVGLTVVAIGTSSPEIAVSVRAALSGTADICLGNVIGSNIANVLFVLGAGSLASPIAVSQRLIRLDVPLMIGVSVLLWLLSLDGSLGRMEGVLLLVGAVLYLGFTIRAGSADEAMTGGDAWAGEPETAGKPAVSWPKQTALVLAGLALLVIGATWLVNGAVTVARLMGVSELIIGLTIIAVGTSLPEAATAVTAGLRRQADIAVGNVVGSNILNILVVLGLALIVSPRPIQVPVPALHFDIPVMVATATACLPVFFIGGRISRGVGALFLGYYVAYVTYLVLLASQHDALPAFSRTMTLFVIPLTAITLGALVLRTFRAGRTSRERSV